MSTTSLAFAPPRALPRTVSSSVPSECECSKTFNLAVEQGATLSSQITITLNGVPVNLTGGTFQFTAKLDPADADNAPSTVKIDWQELATPTTGITWLVIPAATTQTMQPVGYSYQVRYRSSSGVVTPICKGILTIVVPVSSRF